jgi:thiamine biosynthesis lipoprotein ApbE
MADTLDKVRGRAGTGELPIRSSTTIVAKDHPVPQALAAFRRPSGRRALVAGWVALAMGGCRSAHRLPTVSRAWEGMGTVFSVAAWGPDSGRLAQAVAQAHDSVRVVDSLLSSEDSGSELSRVNRAGMGVSLSPAFRGVLSVALEIARSSHGAFDPTRGRWQRIRFDSAAGRVALPRGQMLDLQWVAEGYGLDRALLAVVPFADSAVLTMGAQYLIMTKNVRGTSLGSGRSVGVMDPSTLRTIAMIGVPAGTWAVSTTSQADRPDVAADARNEGRAPRVRTVAALGPRAVAAMAWSSAFFGLGCDRALAVAAERGDVEVLCIDDRVRWSAGLEGRIRTTRDSAAVGTGLAPGPAHAPVAGLAPSGSTRPRASLDSSRSVRRTS